MTAADNVEHTLAQRHEHTILTRLAIAEILFRQ